MTNSEFPTTPPTNDELASATTPVDVTPDMYKPDEYLDTFMRGASAGSHILRAQIGRYKNIEHVVDEPFTRAAEGRPQKPEVRDILNEYNNAIAKITGTTKPDQADQPAAPNADDEAALPPRTTMQRLGLEDGYDTERYNRGNQQLLASYRPFGETSRVLTWDELNDRLGSVAVGMVEVADEHTVPEYPDMVAITDPDGELQRVGIYRTIAPMQPPAGENETRIESYPPEGMDAATGIPDTIRRYAAAVQEAYDQARPVEAVLADTDQPS